tara:strand:- start:3429 stop:4046 length:618 start_codon:yes stop_codon:yes gene_type:complete
MASKKRMIQTVSLEAVDAIFENNSTTLLPRGDKLVIQADDPDYMRGLIIELLPEGGYNVQYWYEDPNNVYPIEVVVDGISVADAGENITLKFHPELAKDDPQMAESYNDYPQAARNNAKRAIEYKEENGSSCGTSVGWTRARQLVNGDKISLDTIKRMAAFKRHQQHRNVPYSEGCGGIMWDCWGGSSGINWAIAKVKRIEKENK